ncbi:MAG: hypothetical protein WBB31_07855 [Saprospiraceae bacterium]
MKRQDELFEGKKEKEKAKEKAKDEMKAKAEVSFLPIENPYWANKYCMPAQPQ